MRKRAEVKPVLPVIVGPARVPPARGVQAGCWVFASAMLALVPSLAAGQIHAMLNYETKSAESLKGLKKPYKIQLVEVPGCGVGEDVVFSEDGKHWYLSCMGTQAMIVGDAKTDKPLKTVKVAAPYPHGIAIHK